MNRHSCAYPWQGAHPRCDFEGQNLAPEVIVHRSTIEFKLETARCK